MTGVAADLTALDMPADGDRTAALAAWSVSRRSDQLDARDVEQLERLILDHLGCVWGGSALPWGRALVDWAGDYVSAGNSPVVGAAQSASAPIAAMVNATAAHGMELDDTHDASLSHPGAGVIATALAVAAETGASGRELLNAIAVGYEVTGRVGMATGASILERGFHPTALFGGFGAATAAALLYGLDAQRLGDAWGLLLSMAGGSAQFSQDPRGTVVKRLHGGFGAKNGVVAAQLARRGISGPSGALDGHYGLINLFGSDDRLPENLEPPAGELLFHRLSLKPYPFCRLFHSTADALQEVLGELPARHMAGDIARIRVGGPAVLLSQHMLRRPTSMMAAQYSLPYTLGAIVDMGPYLLEPFEEDKLAEPRRLAIADRVECVADAEMQAAFPQHFGSWVEVEWTDGRRAKSTRLDSLGTPTHPLSREALLGKVEGLLAGAAAGVSAEELDGAIRRIYIEDSPAALLELLRRG